MSRLDRLNPSAESRELSKKHDVQAIDITIFLLHLLQQVSMLLYTAPVPAWTS